MGLNPISLSTATKWHILKKHALIFAPFLVGPALWASFHLSLPLNEDVCKASAFKRDLDTALGFESAPTRLHLLINRFRAVRPIAPPKPLVPVASGEGHGHDDHAEHDSHDAAHHEEAKGHNHQAEQNAGGVLGFLGLGNSTQEHGAHH
eukprot:TRINITY_DN8401_c0_g1_i1.p1 TRINITY_DN8401_c0_g1~~TRINITY_DN8401_c0_g1_i1.p1  ORF type:complete len:157 (+),score=19.16 TRINITY_DN8401_c0_g1_i1:25-471(+)